MICAAVWFGAGHALLGRIDRTLYDAALALWKRPPPSGIVTVVVDEASIAALGRWPWRRALHATLIEKLAASRPKAIAFDVIVSEPDAGDPLSDEALVRAVAAAGNVVLASLVVDVPGVGARDLVPLEPFRRAAAAVAHIQVDRDDDGVVRGLHLLDGADVQRPYLALAALQVAGRSPRLPPGYSKGGDTGAVRTERYLIPFYGPSGTIRQFSYLEVLRGDVAASEFAGRIVFVGTTASGLGDEHPSPAGGRTAPMAGVEIAAQIAGALDEGIAIRMATPMQSAVVSSAIALPLLALYRVLQPRTALMATAVAFVVTLSGAFTAFRLSHVWLPPSSALFGIALCYPLWTWRRLEAALRYMRAELGRLRAEPAGIPSTKAGSPAASLAGDTVDATIASLQSAIAGLRDARRFIADTVESLPQALFVSDPEGRVVLTNSRAREWASFETFRARQAAGIEPMTESGNSTLQMLADFRPGGARTWESLIEESLARRQVTQAEARGPGGRDVLVLFSPCYRASGETAGLIVNMVDVSEWRAAERRHEDALRVLSHDMRAPQASIITLLEMHALDRASLDTETLLGRVGSCARRTLDLADDFLRLARAEQVRESQFVELDLADIAAEACEEAWTLAHAKSIRIVRDFAVEEAPLLGDRSLLLRMLQNLLTNAIKFSPAATTVTVVLEAQGVSWLLRVCDEGRGISREDQSRLFTRFGRVGGVKDDPGGIGLGLVMVRTVVERHRGVVSVASDIGEGSTFSVSLPALRKARQG